MPRVRSNGVHFSNGMSAMAGWRLVDAPLSLVLPFSVVLKALK